MNYPLFYHRNVTPFDAIIARMAIEIIGNYGAAIFSYLLLYWIGAVEWPRTQCTAPISRIFLHDLVVRRSRAVYRRIQRAHAAIRKGMVTGIIYLSAGFRLSVHGCVVAGFGAIIFVDVYAIAPVL